MDVNITLLGELITFSVLLWVVAKYCWPPLMSKLEERQQQIAQGLSNFEKSKHELARVEKKIEEDIIKTKGEANLILDLARQQADLIVSEAKIIAEEQKEKIVMEADKDIKFKTAQALKAIRLDQVEILTKIVEKVLEEDVTLEMKEKFVDDAIEKL